MNKHERDLLETIKLPKELRDKIYDLTEFLDKLKAYRARLYKAKKEVPTKKEANEIWNFREELLKESSTFRKLIRELTDIDKVTITKKSGQQYSYDVWFTALGSQMSPHSISAIDNCIDITVAAIGKLESDVQAGIRDEQGNLIEVSPKSASELPKAFIAHEGETTALKNLKEFLDALGIRYYIAESKASDGRSIERQVDWSQGKGDFAIILATKGKAINKKTGNPYMGLNVADELGRARTVFKNKIILLLEKGVEPHTNIEEIVHERFSARSMDKAFIKIVKELKNWGFLSAGKMEN